MPRYKITVDGTAIEEIYEFDQFLSEDEVRQIWYQDVQKQRGALIASLMQGSINVKQLGDGPEGRLE